MLRSIVLAWVVLTGSVAQAALPPSERLLPDITQGWLSVPHVATARAAFRDTQFGEFLADPALKAFWESARGEAKAIRDRRGSSLDISLDDLEQIASGETALAMVAAENHLGLPGRVLLVDVTGREPAATAVVQKITDDILRRGGKVAALSHGAVAMQHYQRDDRELVVFMHQGLLCLARQPRLALAVAARLTGQPAVNTPSLADNAAFRYVQTRLLADQGVVADREHVSWYVKPIGYALSQRALQPQRDPNDTAERGDLIESLSATGFDALQGAGGRLTFGLKAYDTVHRMAFYAPNRQQWAGSMNLLSFVNGAGWEQLPAWVPADLATHSTINIDIQKAFDHVGPLFDRVKGGPNSTGLWERTLRRVSSRRPGSPGVDIREQIIKRLGWQGHIVTDNKRSPAGQLMGPNDERLLFAMPIQAISADAGIPQAQAAVADGLARILAPDQQHVRRNVELAPGQVVWALLRDRKDEQVQLDDVRIELNGQVNVQAAPEVLDLEPAAVCVAHGHLLYATHLSLMGEVLENMRRWESSPAEARPSLAVSHEYKAVVEALRNEATTRSWDQACLMRYARTGEELRGTYELMQQGRLQDSQTLIARALRSLPRTGGGMNEDTRLDVNKLPSYADVRGHFQPSAQLGRAEADGWFIVAITLAGDAAREGHRGNSTAEHHDGRSSQR